MSSSKPLFQHRHYCKIAEIIAALKGNPYISDDAHEVLLLHFANQLGSTNAQFSEDRFIAAAAGNPSGRDKVRS